MSKFSSMARKQDEEELRASNGNIIALACGPLRQKRHINPKIEAELVDFKKEIEGKFAKSPLRSFVMPRKASQVGQRSRINEGSQLRAAER